MAEQQRLSHSDEDADDTESTAPDSSASDAEGEDLDELVDRMEERVKHERRESDVDGHVGEREEVTPVEPDDQAPD